MIDDSDHLAFDARRDHSRLINCIHGKAREIFRLLGHQRALDYLGSRFEVTEADAGAWLAEFREET